jgi:hypothetical protein
VRAAREKLERVQQQAEAGAASRRQVEAAEAELQQAKDDAVLADTLGAGIGVEELTEEQSAAMTEAAARRLTREQARLSGQAKLVAEGVAPRVSLAPYEQQVADARRMVDVAQERARSLAEIAAMIRAEQELETAPGEPAAFIGPMPVMTRFAGGGQFSNSDFKRVVLAYEKEFERKLPVSARGETALHHSMGFNHAGRVDVAVNPDQAEGKWLMQYLEKSNIPYFAFRYRVAGQATAPHIHIGPPSTRLRASD